MGSSTSLFPPMTPHGSMQLGPAPLARAVGAAVQLSSLTPHVTDTSGRQLVASAPPPATTTRGGAFKDPQLSTCVAWPGDATAPAFGGAVPPSLTHVSIAAAPPDTARGRSCSPVMCRTAVHASNLVSASSMHISQPPHHIQQQQHLPVSGVSQHAGTALAAAQLSPRLRHAVLAPQPQMQHGAGAPQIVLAPGASRVLSPVLAGGQNGGRRTIGL
mmetsp:Transcript_95138/g.275054  ORF Transcript_95138/g.275054 Transcript_95138/m.275054 type:complete len:216 (+) Transcript_95138:1-648(+)